MCEAPLNHKDLFHEVNTSDQTVLIATDVEDESSTLLPDIGRRKRPLHPGKVRPVRLPCDSKKAPQRLPSVSMLVGEA